MSMQRLTAAHFEPMFGLVRPTWLRFERTGAGRRCCRRGDAVNEPDAARRFGFDGEVVPGIGFAGTRITAVVRPDLVEVARREHIGLGAVLDFDVTDRLANLPVDWPIPRDELDPITLQLLEMAPPGVVEDTTTAVIRRWRPAVTVTGILLTTGRQWRSGLRSVSLFAPDAPRGIVLRRLPSDEQALRDEAIELGVGVIAPDPEGGWRLLVDPLRDTRYDLGPRHWRLLEITYLAWREHTYAARATQLFR
jgi:hypothetical protein